MTMMGRVLPQWHSFVVLIAVAVLLVDAGRIMQYNSRTRITSSHGVKLVRRMQVGNKDEYENDQSGMSMPLTLLDYYFDYDSNNNGVGGNDNEAGSMLTNTVSLPDITPCFRGSRNFLRKKGAGINGSEEEVVVNCDVAGIGGITNNDEDEDEQQELDPATFKEDDDFIPVSCQLGSRNYRDAAGKVRSCSTFSSINSNSFEGGVGGIGNNNLNMEAEESNDAIDIIDIGGSDTTKDDDSTTTSDAKQDDEIVWVVVDLDNGSDSLTTTTSDGKDSTITTINKIPPPLSTTTNSTTNSTIIIVPLTDPSTKDTSKGLSSGAIAGIAIAAITSLIVLAVASAKKKILVYRSNRNKNNNNEDGGGMDGADDDLAVMDVTHVEKERIAVSQTPTGAAATTTRVRLGSPDATAITASFSDVTSTGDADSTTHSAFHMGSGMVRVLSGSISSIGEETPNGSGDDNNMMVTRDSPYFVTPYHTSEMNDYYAKNSLLMTTTNNNVDDEESMLSTPSFFSSCEEADPVPLSGEADASIASTSWSVAETIRRFNSTAAPATVTGGSSLAAMGAAGNAVITSPGGCSSSSSRRQEED